MGVELICCFLLVFSLLGVCVFWVVLYFGEVGDWRICSHELLELNS